MEKVSQVVLEGHEAFVSAVAEIESRRIIVSTSGDNTLKAWSLDQGTCRNTICSLDGPIIGRVAVLDDTNLLVTGFDSSVRIVRVTDGRFLAERRFALPITSCVVVSPSVAIVGDEDGNLFKLKFDEDKISILQQVEDAHKEDGEVTSIHVHGNKFSTSIWEEDEADTTVKLWDSETLSLIHTFDGYKGSITDCTFNDSYLVMAAFHEDAIFVYNVETYELITTIRKYTHSIVYVCLVKDTDILIAGGGECVLALYSLPSGDCIAKYDVGIWIRRVTVLSSGKVAVYGEIQNSIKILDIPELRNSKPAQEKVHTSSPSTIPNGLIRDQRHEKMNSQARKLFKETAEKEGCSDLTIDDATDVLNTMVVDESKQIDALEFERLFMEVSDEIQVTESAFLRVLDKLNNPHVNLKVLYSSIFKKYVNKRDAVSIPYAIRVLRECFKNAKDQNLIMNQDQQLAEDSSLRESMAKFDAVGKGNLNHDNFIAAALSIIHDCSR